MFFDFTTGAFALNSIGVNNWGLTGISTKAMAFTNATFNLTNGPIPNTYTALVNIMANGSQNLITFNLMPTNNGNTLLLQEGVAGNNDGEPSTGVCNKI